MNIVKDDSGVDYSLMSMPANGLCGFSCVAYCLSGDKYAYMDVIEDSFCVFDENPNLFIELTEFGRKYLNLSMYRDHMRNAVANVSSQLLDPMFWQEDAHLIAFSMLYDIAVFVYNSPWKRWVVYNDTGSRGYICLHFNGSHFDVLQGIGTATVVRPPIPRRVVPVHQDMHVSLNNAKPCKTYSFSGVWNWHSNDTALPATTTTQARLSYADIVKIRRPTSHLHSTNPAAAVNYPPQHPAAKKSAVQKKPTLPRQTSLQPKQPTKRCLLYTSPSPRD